MNAKTNKYFKVVDAEKVSAMTKAKFGSHAELCRMIGVNSHQISDMIRKGGYIRILTMNSICHALGVPNDYFDKVEEPEPVPEPEPKEEPKDCGVDLADIQYSMNIFEQKLNQIVDALVEQNALITEQNNLLSQQTTIMRGKLQKGERVNEVKGNTNSGGVHSYLVGSSFPFKA